MMCLALVSRAIGESAQAPLRGETAVVLAESEGVVETFSQSVCNGSGFAVAETPVFTSADGGQTILDSDRKP
jgi:hypothetical protein